jgi:hypothetical protein
MNRKDVLIVEGLGNNKGTTETAAEEAASVAVIDGKNLGEQMLSFNYASFERSERGKNEGPRCTFVFIMLFNTLSKSK